MILLIQAGSTGVQQAKFGTGKIHRKDKQLHDYFGALGRWSVFACTPLRLCQEANS